MAWIYRVRKNLHPIPEPTVQWSRYNERKYPRYANIGRVPDHLRRAGRKKGFRKRRGAHVSSICIPPDAQFAYEEICIQRIYSRWRRAVSPDRLIERNLGIGTSSSPSSRLLIGMHMTVY